MPKRARAHRKLPTKIAAMGSGGSFARENGTFRGGTANSIGPPPTFMFRNPLWATTLRFTTFRATTSPAGKAESSRAICFGPQYNIRIGRFINADRTLGVELSFDHSK